MMQIIGPQKQQTTDEFSIIRGNLKLRDAHVLELGCGNAQKTRQIAQSFGVANLVAAEVDQAAHTANLTIADLPNVTFKSYAAQAIAEQDASFNVVMMFKSLHHVPIAEMDQALMEISRVLKPGGYLYVSEPVFAGEFNEIMRLFHDEQIVREAAFAAMQRAVQSNLFELRDEIFFRNRLRMESFAQYEQATLNVTHTQHNLTPELLEVIRARFERARSAEGFVFEIPNRVDILQRASD